MSSSIEFRATFEDRVTSALSGIEARIQGLAQKTDRAFDPASKHLVDIEGLLGKLYDPAKKAEGGFDGLGGSLRKVTKEGLAQLSQTIPGAGHAIEGVTNLFGGFGLALGGILGVGALVINFLQDMQKEADETLNRIASLNDRLTTGARTTASEVARIRAEARGDKVGAAGAGFDTTLQQIELEKRERIRAAEEIEQAEARRLFTPTNKVKLAEAATIRANAEGEAANKAARTAPQSITSPNSSRLSI